MRSVTPLFLTTQRLAARRGAGVTGHREGGAVLLGDGCEVHALGADGLQGRVVRRPWPRGCPALVVVGRAGGAGWARRGGEGQRGRGGESGGDRGGAGGGYGARGA